MARTGRRRGNSGTREAILAAARDRFAAEGYARATIRTIAAAAAVDPALVHHYFGTKQELFTAALDLPVDIPRALAEVLSGDPHDVGERLVRRFLAEWDGPEARSALTALLRTAVTSEQVADMAREFMVGELLGRAVRALDPPHGAWRTTLVASQLLGLAMGRYVLRIEPLASADAETLAATLGPTVQRYLTGELPPAPQAPDANGW